MFLFPCFALLFFHQTNKHRMIEQTLEVIEQNKKIAKQWLEVEEDRDDRND
jgi:hypothetical protein